MKKIENRGGVLSGYVPDLPGKHRKTWRNAVSYFNSIRQDGKIVKNLLTITRNGNILYVTRNKKRGENNRGEK